MTWEQILGFFTLWLHPEITVGLWSRAGVPIWQTFLYTTLWTSMTLILTYFGSGLLKKWLKKRKIILKQIEKISSWHSNTNSRHQKRLINWLGRKKNWFILACGFFPFIYGLPAAVIVTAKLLEIENALIFLLLGNIFRCAVIVLVIYQGFKLFA